MDNMIIVDLTLFTKEQTIFLQQHGLSIAKKCDMDTIPEVVLDMCKEYNINEVKINGIIDYANKIAKEIELKEKIEYSENKINIEVI